MKKRFVFVCAIVFVTAMFSACGQKEDNTIQDMIIREDEEQGYPTFVVSKNDVIKNATINCKYNSTEIVSMSFPVDGKLVAEVNVKKGDYVKKGQLIASLDLEDIESNIDELAYTVEHLELQLEHEIQKRDFELEAARINYEGYTKMTADDKKNYKEQVEQIEKQYKTTIENLQDSLEINKDRLAKSKQEMDQGRLYAEISGQVTSMQNPLKNTYSVKDSKIITISNLDACYFVSEDVTYADYFTEGEPVTLTYKASGKDVECEVVPVMSERWDESLYFSPNLEEELESDLKGKIVIELERKTNVLCVPTDAIHSSDNGPFVYLSTDGLLEMRYVETGLSGDSLTEIVSGLEEGDIVAIN